MKHLRSERTRRGEGSLAEFQGLSGADRGKIQGHNQPVGAMLETYRLVRLQLEWTHQMAPLLGVEEVEKLEVRRRTLKTTGRDHRRLTYEQLSTSPFLQTKESETELVKLLVNTGAGHQNGKEKA